ncbi:MAG: beta-ketoacyl-[acyl-carrier-protein] synthase II, partial [Candidatus Omnitrophica bacterium]|nr:beta-ketoacyl-[acyl-carrier-protein] synthase II [Candidatus Omnitrophota bacterium]
MSRRVVVTGVGIVAPNGIGNEECFNAMVNGVSGIERVTEFDVSQFNTKIAAQVRRFDPIALGLTRQEAIRMDRYVQFAVVAARMAWEDSGLGAARIDKERMG